ncbi:MAG: hypothetical protein GXY55_15895 [Phycisphaerae bacterium]|nr:hypothetical protein [Phycisphaerae bacterium]
MRLKSMMTWMANRRAWLTLGSGGALFAAVPGCDPDVQAILVSGFEAATTSAITAMIKALFQTITPSTTDSLVMIDTLRDLVTRLA